MYIPDLSRYVDGKDAAFLDGLRLDGIIIAFPDALCVGWLDASHPFPKGGRGLDQEVLDRLFAHCLIPVHFTGGHHTCEFCEGGDWSDRPDAVHIWAARLEAERNGETANQDNGEILVTGEEGAAFLAPVMIYHYVIEHDYLPPDTFLHVLQTSDPEKGFLIGRESWRRRDNVKDPDFFDLWHPYGKHYLVKQNQSALP